VPPNGVPADDVSTVPTTVLLEDESEAYRGIFEHALWGIYQTTLDGHFIRANVALARIYGYDSPAAMFRDLTNIGRQLYVDPTHRNEFERLITENDAVLNFESEAYRRDGAIIWISTSCRAVRAANGDLLYYEGFVEDITARKRTEMDLRIARELAERSSKAKSAFLANMSHELRTPLNAILGFSEILESELFGPLGDPRYAEFAQDINRSGKHLLAIICDILDLAKVEAGQLEINDSEVDVVTLLQSCERLIAPVARSREISLTVNLPPETVVVRADETRLKQILLNLLSNAVKFTPPGNAVVLSGQRIMDGIVLRVSDTGIGMSAENIEEAMQPFHQIDNSLSRRYEGTGLGLPLTQSLVDSHGGAMKIESVVGEGTTVTVTLPGWRIVEA
jgi:PAS domain S-box-containing protein